MRVALIAAALVALLAVPSSAVGSKDRKAPSIPKGLTATTGKGQKVSLERGSHTRSKKNPGKRPHSG